MNVIAGRECRWMLTNFAGRHMYEAPRNLLRMVTMSGRKRVEQ